MIPPTSIDGTDITGATIDGTDVTEITVDGDVVFSAVTLPVAYSNLVAWYPFDSATYGGSNADDVTAIIGGSGDDTAYDASVFGATYISNGGLTDINKGANSGAFDFDGSNDALQTDSKIAFGSHTKMCWIDANYNQTAISSVTHIFGGKDSPKPEYTFIGIHNGTIRYVLDDGNISIDRIITHSVSNGKHHAAITYDRSDGSCELFVDGTSVGTASKPSGLNFDAQQEFGASFTEGVRFTDATIDDARIYDTVLSQSQINQIYQNTQP